MSSGERVPAGWLNDAPSSRCSRFLGGCFTGDACLTGRARPPLKDSQAQGGLPPAGRLQQAALFQQPEPGTRGEAQITPSCGWACNPRRDSLTPRSEGVANGCQRYCTMTTSTSAAHPAGNCATHERATREEKNNGTILGFRCKDYVGLNSSSKPHPAFPSLSKSQLPRTARVLCASNACD